MLAAAWNSDVPDGTSFLAMLSWMTSFSSLCGLASRPMPPVRSRRSLRTGP